MKIDGNFSGAHKDFSITQTPSVLKPAIFSATSLFVLSPASCLAFVLYSASCPAVRFLELRGFSRMRHSVQITVGEPRVSTDSSCLIRAFREAIRLEARLRARVTVERSPSGTFATII